VDDIYSRQRLIFNQWKRRWPNYVFSVSHGSSVSHAGTYYPKTDRYGHGPRFSGYGSGKATPYQNRRNSYDISAAVQIACQHQGLPTNLPDRCAELKLLAKANHRAVRNVDPIHGGLSKGSPKFPSPMNLIVLRFREYWIVRSPHIRNLFATEKWHGGGIYDQVGGDFTVYSVDERWFGATTFEKSAV